MQKTDDMLISEIRDGKIEAFDELMQQHQAQVYRVAFGYTKNEDQAMDITQNVFLKIYENLNKFHGRSMFKTWMMRITFNESLNWIKKNRLDMRIGNADEIVSSEDQENSVLVQENRVLMLRSLHKLNTRYRLAVILRYFENYSVREISGVLKCSEGVVKNMLFRSIQQLKNHLHNTQKEEIQ